MAYGGNPADVADPSVDAYGGFDVGDFGPDDAGGAPEMSLFQHREKARLSARDIIEAMNKARSQQVELDPITLQQPTNKLNLVNFTPARSLIANARNYPGMVNPESDWHSDRARDADPWAGWTGPIFDHTNSIKDMQDMGHGKLSFLAGMIPGVRQMTSLLNSINLHDLGPYMTEEEFNWDDARWEGGANSDFMSNIFTPRHLQINENPHTTDALAYGNAYNMWEGGDQPD